MANLYLDIHVLQTVPPSCINRDDTGSPKTAVYGGALRARVSSQAWKKAVRDYFKANAIDSGIRTKNIIDIVINEIGGDKVEAKKLAEKILNA
jgi:CRISPR system Cascade subunit CasC